jgi:hypothetical protein
MTRYTVIWDDDLLDLYIRSWTKSDPQVRATLTDVANFVDHYLEFDADLKGRPTIDGALQVAYVPVPHARVTVTFEVFPDDRLVRVVRMTFVGER